MRQHYSVLHSDCGFLNLAPYLFYLRYYVIFVIFQMVRWSVYIFRYSARACF